MAVRVFRSGASIEPMGPVRRRAARQAGRCAYPRRATAWVRVNGAKPLACATRRATCRHVDPNGAVEHRTQLHNA